MSQEPRVMGPESSQETRCEAIVRERITRNNGTTSATCQFNGRSPVAIELFPFTFLA